MSNFNLAIPIILRHEGRFVNNPSDSGGATNYGISFRFLKNLVGQNDELLSQLDLNGNKLIDPYDIQHMDENKAIDLYRVEWWERYNYGDINDQTLATKVFDLAVNIGPNKAGRLLQEACIDLADNSNLLKIDGVLGMKTLNYVNSLLAGQVAKLLVTFCNKASEYYHQLTARNPILAKFLTGWLNRLYDIHDLQSSPQQIKI